jgi:DNA-binding NtrC family response regulator
MTDRILVVDDERAFLSSVKRGLKINGFRNVEVESYPERAVGLFRTGEVFDIALIDITMPVMNGVQLLQFIRDTSPETECIMVTAINDAKTAMDCMKRGAYDYLVKPISSDDLIAAVNRALERKRLLEVVDLAKERTRSTLTNPKAFESIVTKSPKVLKLLKEAELHAASKVPVLITGESGTGKELLARAIHKVSLRAKGPFLPVNMLSLSESLFDAEFFGHTRGAFTGAEKERIGYLEHTNGGTLFLDEIGNLPMNLQGKLLRVLQEGEYIKIGTNEPRISDVRYIAATNAVLSQSVAEEKFRKDLYYRLRGAWIQIPALRERKEDIPLLANRFLEEFCEESETRGIEEEALTMLVEYDYPGNIRELKSIIQTAVNVSRGLPISPRVLPDFIQRRKKMAVEVQGRYTSYATLAELEKTHVLKTYKETGKNKTRTAKVLGVSLNTLRKKLRAYEQGQQKKGNPER